MKNRIIIPSILFVLVVGLSLFLLFNNQSSLESVQQSETLGEGIILFYGDGCPHCVIVEEYVSQNGIATKIPFVEKEVYYNSQNANDLVAKAIICGIPTDSIGVPFLWDGSKCFVGDHDIIEFFKSKIN